MKPSQPVKRYAPPRKKRAKQRRGEPTATRRAIRQAVYERAEGRCDLRGRPSLDQRNSWRAAAKRTYSHAGIWFTYTPSADLGGGWVI